MIIQCEKKCSHILKVTADCQGGFQLEFVSVSRVINHMGGFQLIDLIAYWEL